ncbi:hypothetical protein GC173_12855 [bacterium]|nr:hypothetical protein [bacterium]
MEGEQQKNETERKSQAKLDEDFEHLASRALAAMERAGELARDIAIQTNTAIVMVRDGKTVWVTADELRRERAEAAAKGNEAT